jgi:DNA-directed RNA polymerase specialized sigma24 family protein
VISFAESVFRRHFRTVHGFILCRVWDRDRADDLAQQGFVDVTSKLISSWPKRLVVSAPPKCRSFQAFILATTLGLPDRLGHGRPALSSTPTT